MFVPDPDMKPATFKGLSFSAGEKMGVMGMGFPFKSQEMRAIVTTRKCTLFVYAASKVWFDNVSHLSHNKIFREKGFQWFDFIANSSLYEPQPCFQN